MAVTAAVKFTQGATTDLPGRALVGVAGMLVVASNGDNSNVQVWTWEVLYVPPGSAVPTGVVATGSTPTFQFTPDLPGGYVLRLTVQDASGLVAADVRVFQVLEPSGRRKPPFGADARSFNFGGQASGWDPAMREWLAVADASAATTSGAGGAQNDFATAAVPTTPGPGLSIPALRLTGGPSITGFANGYEGKRLLVHAVGAPLTLQHQNAGSAAANRIITDTGAAVTVAADTSRELVYDGTTQRWRLLLAGGGGGGGGVPGGAVNSVQFNNGGAFGGFGDYNSGLDSLAVGAGSTATGSLGVAMGDANHAAGLTSTALGSNATASRPGEFAHSSQGASGAEGLHAIDLRSQGIAAPVNLVDGAAAELHLDNSKSYSIRVRAMASKQGAQACAHEVHEMLVHASAGVVAINQDDVLTNPAVNFASLGYSLTISAPGGLVLRFRCDPAADTVDFIARVEWSALPGA